MPFTHQLEIDIDKQAVETGDIANAGVNISWALEDPENFEQKQGQMALDIDVPATPANDRIFNEFHNPAVEDMTGTGRFTNPRTCSIKVGGIEVLRGKSLLQSGSHTRQPGGYNINCYGQNGDWVIDAKDLTLWDCLNTTPHLFNVATVENSWSQFDLDEFHDFVYAPVRYRQPFGPNDDTVNIYHLRPSISIYWLLFRGFRQLGYKIDSLFLNTDTYFRRFVMPWTWGDFYDINSQLTDAILFKAAGQIPYPSGPPVGYVNFHGHPVYFGYGSMAMGIDPDNTGWTPWGPYDVAAPSDAPATATGYIHSLTEHSGGTTLYQNFRINNINPPNGFDNFGLYSFDEPTGTMQYTLNPPATLAAFIGGAVTCVFALNLIAKTFCSSSGTHTKIIIEISKNGVFVRDEEFTELESIAGGTTGDYTYPTTHTFSVSGVNIGDVLTFRLKWDTDSILDAIIQILSSAYLNENPAALGASNWQYNPITERFQNISGGSSAPVWKPIYSTLAMTGIQVELGSQVHFQFYDKFRNYKWLDVLRGLVDMFDLSINTNPIDKIVTIEPTHDYVLPDGTQMPGYYSDQRLDWTAKQDVAKDNIVQLFSDNERIFDFQFKQDGSDGGQNIWAARYKSIYLDNTLTQRIQYGSVDNGVYGGVPGAGRYVFPPRFRYGNRQKTNRFFSATMHYNHEPWRNLDGLVNPAPQLIAIFPENINDSSASAVSATFEPKIACYKGLVGSDYGRWRWIGDPDHPYDEAVAISNDLPFMFAVNYFQGGYKDPILTYCDQNIAGVIGLGLIKQYFLKRLATIRQGKLYKPWMKLSMDDITRWEHRNKIIIGNAEYDIIAIENFNPLSDEAAQCTFWREANPTGDDLSNCYPSNEALTTPSSLLTSFDMKYARLLLYGTDIPQV